MSRRISMRSNTELSWRRAPYCLRLSKKRDHLRLRKGR
nr:MAG TPA: hypothetical protein [Bacteriophage sp.]